MKRLTVHLRIVCALAVGGVNLSGYCQDTGTTYGSLFGPPIAAADSSAVSGAAIPKANKVDQSKAAVMQKSRGCISCHENSHDPHASEFVRLGCTDCHGGDPTPGLTMRQAHPAPRNPVFFESSANPSSSDVLLNHESPEFIQFVNPGDLRVAKKTCGDCHAESVDHVDHSMMRHGAMLWGAAAYNNGAYPVKDAIFGQAYGANGVPLALQSPIKVTPEMQRTMGIVQEIFPLPRFNVSTFRKPAIFSGSLKKVEPSWENSAIPIPPSHRANPSGVWESAGLAHSQESIR